ncbi:hypothetical protein K7432_011064 [Basidiobolus ranarum]|uniref:Mid2 domain-containing protein n=1 Tax=Basidiobolus ranarum TaxID=34480 RepID=A0ABR2WMY5_9FUNG
MSRTHRLSMFMLVLLLSCSLALNVSRREFLDNPQFLAAGLPADTGSIAGVANVPDPAPSTPSVDPGPSSVPPVVTPPSETPKPTPTPTPEPTKPTPTPEPTKPTPTPGVTSTPPTTPPPNTKPTSNDPEPTKPTNPTPGTTPPVPTPGSTAKPPTTKYSSIMVTVTNSNGSKVTSVSTTSSVETDIPSDPPAKQEGSDSGSSKTVMTVGIVVGCVVVLSAVGIWVFRKWKLKPSRNFKDKINSDTDNFFSPPAHSTVSNRDRDAVFLRELNES